MKCTCIEIGRDGRRYSGLSQQEQAAGYLGSDGLDDAAELAVLYIAYASVIRHHIFTVRRSADKTHNKPNNARTPTRHFEGRAAIVRLNFGSLTLSRYRTR